MSKKDNNINNVDEADVNINDTDVTSDTDKDADTVEAQGSSDADVKAEKSDNASDAQGAEETVLIHTSCLGARGLYLPLLSASGSMQDMIKM